MCINKFIELIDEKFIDYMFNLTCHEYENENLEELRSTLLVLAKNPNYWHKHGTSDFEVDIDNLMYHDYGPIEFGTNKQLSQEETENYLNKYSQNIEDNIYKGKCIEFYFDADEEEYPHIDTSITIYMNKNNPMFYTSVQD